MSNKRTLVSKNLTSDDAFKKEMEKIRDKGYIESHRTGNTGVGKTLEDELGIQENSSQSSDIGDVELKANRIDSNSKITLFTKAPNKRGVNNSILRKKYGYQTDESKELNKEAKILHTSVNGSSFNTLNGEEFMKLTVQNDRLYLEHAKDGILQDVYWDKSRLTQAFNKKYPAKKMYHVHAKSKKIKGKEAFHYTEVYSLENFSADKMLDGLISGDLEMDIRLGLHASGNKKGKPHDNGTAIRVSPSQLDDCFDTKKKLL